MKPSKTLDAQSVANRRHKVGVRSLLTCISSAVLSLSLLVSAHAQDAALSHFVAFNAPNAGSGASQGTFPSAINKNGWIAGTVVYKTGVSHGFLRQASGTYIAVNAPTATQTFVSAINASNEAVGFFNTPTLIKSFLRNAAGKYTVLAVATADTTVATGINASETIVGYEHDANGFHGFLWTAKGGFTVFDVPGSALGTTFPLAINNAGTITGSYTDSSSFGHDFVRNPTGKFTTFQPIVGGTDTQATAINTSGQITGWGTDSAGHTDGFLRNATGGITEFFPAGAPGTQPTAINDGGSIVGFTFTTGCCDSAFERDSSGNDSYITVPFTNSGSRAFGINTSGEVMGSYVDAAGAFHGWFGTP